MPYKSKQYMKDYEMVCNIIDRVRTVKQFYEACEEINSGKYDYDAVSSAREVKQFYNSTQYAN